MKNNTKYTALEILKGAGFKNPEKEFGKVKIRIAGIAGIVKPDHLIKIQLGTKRIDVQVANEVKVLKFDGFEEQSVISDNAKKVLNKQSKVK